MNENLSGRLLAWLAFPIFFGVVLSAAAETNREPSGAFPHPDRIRYDRQCLTIDGRDIFIFSGAFHYFRCPKELWPARFEKIKAAGFNTVETYVPWNWHEQEMPSGLDDYSRVDLTDLEDFLKMAEGFGLYVIVRPGPYICAEWNGGGFPQWLWREKPESFQGKKWLRSDEPVYLAWCKHWYNAVCPVIAGHQITRKSRGQPGVILVQLENEYNFARQPKNVMLKQLDALAEAARANGIDVPLFTCWTQPVRANNDPRLQKVFDSCNFYPRWNVNGIQKKIETLRQQQPEAPLMTAELQGGWFAKVGGTLSDQQDGLTGSQINNLTLFTIQNGETILNYYMLFGGTNPGDWAGRDLITSYDYDAPIREWGAVGDRYQRVRALGHMLREHGGKLARSEMVECEVDVPQADVSVVERRAPDDSRYFFVRTGQHAEPRAGTARVTEKDGGARFVFDYNLEPFGSKVFYLPPGVKNVAQGEWLPKPAPPIERPTNLPAGVAITIARSRVDSGPTHWTELATGENLAQAGIYDSRFVFYRVENSGGQTTNLFVEYRAGDAVVAVVDGTSAGPVHKTKSNSVFALPDGWKDVRLLYENSGFANMGDNLAAPAGVDARVNGKSGASAAKLFFGSPTGVEQKWWNPDDQDSLWQTVTVGSDKSRADAALTWYRMDFELPPQNSEVWVPWKLKLKATGDGFLYLNGHAIGRYWQAGPQHDFFLPECWLHFGTGQKNVLVLNLVSAAGTVGIQSATVEPYEKSAEKRR